MKMFTVHPDRYAVARTNESLDPGEEFELIYRNFVMLDFETETDLGFKSAFFRTFAAPRIAALLAATGEMHAEPMKRGIDTGLFMYELITAGLDSPRSREVIRRLNGMHHQYAIDNADYVYVLATFAVLPLRMIERFGWRPLSAHEVEASYRFYREFGRRMAIRDIPPDYAGLVAYLEDYEQREFAQTPAGISLMQSTAGLVSERVPRPMAPLARAMVASVLLDARTRHALGVASPAPVATAALTAILKAQAARRRRQAPAAAWFTPGEVSDIYPDGYTLADLGPASSGRKVGRTTAQSGKVSVDTSATQLD